MTKRRIKIGGAYPDGKISAVLDNVSQHNLDLIRRYYTLAVVPGSKCSVSAAIRAALAYYAKEIRAEWEKTYVRTQPKDSGKVGSGNAGDGSTAHANQ